MRLLKDRRGYAMSYVVMLLALVGLPLMLLSIEVVRALYVDARLQVATDAACEAAAQAVNVPYFIYNGVLKIEVSEGNSYAQREFGTTVARYNLEKYLPALGGITLINPTLVSCTASAQMQFILPIAPPITLNASSVAMAKASSF